MKCFGEIPDITGYFINENDVCFVEPLLYFDPDMVQLGFNDGTNTLLKFNLMNVKKMFPAMIESVFQMCQNNKRFNWFTQNVDVSYHFSKKNGMLERAGIPSQVAPHALEIVQLFMFLMVKIIISEKFSHLSHLLEHSKFDAACLSAYMHNKNNINKLKYHADKEPIFNQNITGKLSYGGSGTFVIKHNVPNVIMFSEKLYVYDVYFIIGSEFQSTYFHKIFLNLYFPALILQLSLLSLQLLLHFHFWTFHNLYVHSLIK